MTIFYPGEASGVLFKSNVTFSAVYAEIIELRLDLFNKFNANVSF